MSNPSLPDMTAMFDQFSTTLENFAVVLKTYHGKLLEQGFSEELAEQLVVEFQNTYWNTLLSVNKPGAVNNYTINNHDQ